MDALNFINSIDTEDKLNLESQLNLADINFQVIRKKLSHCTASKDEIVKYLEIVKIQLSGALTNAYELQDIVKQNWRENGKRKP